MSIRLPDGYIRGLQDVVINDYQGYLFFRRVRTSLRKNKHLFVRTDHTKMWTELERRNLTS